MSWCTTGDLDRFATAAGDYLRSRAAENTLLLSAAHAAVPNAAVPNALGPLFGWWEPPDGSGARGAFLHDPRAPLLISGRAPEMAVALAALLAKTGRPVSGVDAPVDAADAFAAAWQQRAGTAARVQGSCRVYRLACANAAPGESPGQAGSPALAPAASPGPVGRVRVATAADRTLLTEWLTAFATEAGERTGSPAELAADLIGYGGAVFWEVPQRASRLTQAAQFLAGPHHRDTAPPADPGYQPVAVTALTRPVAGMVRVSMVYTLPERRRNGYAAAATFAASRAALDGTALQGDPVTEVVLVTDGSRPDRRVTRLGYQLVDERAMFRFGPPTGPLPKLNPASGPMPRLPTGPLPRLRR
jgi:hypothetical protein